MHDLEVSSQKEHARREGYRERERDRSGQFVGLSKKSNSTSQLSATGKKKYKKLQKTSKLKRKGKSVGSRTERKTR